MNDEIIKRLAEADAGLSRISVSGDAAFILVTARSNIIMAKKALEDQQNETSETEHKK